MVANKKTTKPPVKKQKAKFWKFLPLISIPLIMLAFFLPSIIPDSRQYPLDDKIEYIGKTDYGCDFFCDSKPGSVYYYATNMIYEEVVGHFKNAFLVDEPNTNASTIYFGMTNRDGKSVFITFYRDKRKASSKINATDKKYIFNIPDDSYETLKSFL